MTMLLEWRDEVIQQQKERVQLQLIEAEGLDKAYYEGCLEGLNVSQTLSTMKEFDDAYGQGRRNLFILATDESAGEKRLTIAFLRGALDTLKLVGDKVRVLHDVLIQQEGE
jgi:hypothetical protein